MNPLPIEIICSAYKRPQALAAQLWSFAAQTRKGFSVRVIHDGEFDKEVHTVVRAFAEMNSDIPTSLDFANRRHNDWGHSLREIGLQESKSELMLITNDDNYYAPMFFEYLLPHFETGADIVFCNMIHSHHSPFRDHTFSRSRDLPYRPFVTKPKMNRIDMGSFIFRTQLGQKAGFEDKSFGADGIFFERMLKFNPNVIKVNEYLFVHN